VLSIVISTIAFFVASYYIKRWPTTTTFQGDHAKHLHSSFSDCAGVWRRGSGQDGIGGRDEDCLACGFLLMVSALAGLVFMHALFSARQSLSRSRWPLSHSYGAPRFGSAQFPSAAGVAAVTSS